MTIVSRQGASVLLALGVMACAAAPNTLTPARAPLRPASECAEVRARVDRGEVVAGRDTVFPATPLRIVMPDSRRHGPLPREGQLEVTFFVSLDGRAEPNTVIANGFDGYPSRNAIIAEVLALPFAPGVLDNCAVRTTTKMKFETFVRR